MPRDCATNKYHNEILQFSELFEVPKLRDINKIVRENIKRIRKSKGLTQEALALKADLHRAYLGQVERGEKNIGLKNLQKLADALDIDIKLFFDQFDSDLP